MRLDLHQDMGFICVKIIFTRSRKKPLNQGTFHHCAIIRIRHHSSLWRHRMGIANHGKQAFVLLFAINGPRCIKNFMPAVFRIRLRKHHQFDISGVTFYFFVIIKQVINFIRR